MPPGVRERNVRVAAADPSRGGGLGLRATRDMKAGDVVLSVPFSLTMTPETSRKSPVGKYLADFEGWTGAVGLIAVQLLHEKSRGAASQWAGWIEALPAAAETGALDLPLYWPGEGLDLLEGCSTRPIAELSAEVDEDYAWLEVNAFSEDRALFSPEAFSYENWRWAVGVVMSRSYFVDGATRLTPGVDFANHDPMLKREVSSGAYMMGLAGKAVRVVAEKSYKEGDEICITYGERTGSEFLEEHGFVPSTELERCAQLSLRALIDSFSGQGWY